MIFRTSWVYASRGGNFAKTMLRLAQERERLTVINDQFGAPTGADLLADITAHAISQVRQQPEQTGLYHLTALGETTWFEYAKYVIAKASIASPAIKIIAKDVVPVLSEAFKTAAQRPKNSRLNTEKLQTALNLHLPPWEHGVDRMLAETLLPWPVPQLPLARPT